MRQFTAEIHRFLAAREATTAIEYAIIAAGIACAIIAAVNAVGGSVSAMWDRIASALS
jgi:pilus assembly protein Flp/PilA